MKKRVYLDYAATTPVHPEVMKAMAPYFSEKFGNAGSLHSFGQEAIGAIDKARETIANTLGVNFDEIIFTGSATEANNLALRGIMRAWFDAPQNQNNFGAQNFLLARSPALPARRSSKHQTQAPRIIISSIEHESILETAQDLENNGVEVVRIGVDKNGIINLKKLAESIDERTVLVSVMYANNEIGTIQPIREIARIVRKHKERNGRGPLLHTDAVQAFQYLDCRPDELHVDMMTLSAHKIYGPKGAGLLYVRGSEGIQPILTGGGQEFGYRSSTENVPTIVGFAKAVEIVSKGREKEGERVAALRDYAWAKIKQVYPKARLNGDDKKRLPNNLNFFISGKQVEGLLIRLDLKGIAVSTGSACAARSLDPSHVILALGYPDERAKNSLRLSLGRFTERNDLDKFIKEIED